LEEVDHLRHTEGSREIYAQRKETIERVFADMKEKHGMRWTTLRGLEKVTMQAMLTFVAMNLKKLATWLWKSGRPFDNNPRFSSTFISFNDKLPMRCMSFGSLSSI
jgi:Transposase DDE domain